MSMTLVRREAGSVTVLEIGGRIAFGETAGALQAEVRELLSAGRGRIVLNLKQVTHIDSAGIGEIVGSHTSARNQGGSLKLAALSPRVENLLRMTRLFIALDVYPDEASAVAAFGE